MSIVATGTGACDDSNDNVPHTIVALSSALLAIWILRPQNGPGDSLFWRRFERVMILDPSTIMDFSLANNRLKA